MSNSKAPFLEQAALSVVRGRLADKRRKAVILHPVRKGSLLAMKKAALRASDSAKRQPVADVRQAFGLFPANVSVEIIAWPQS